MRVVLGEESLKVSLNFFKSFRSLKRFVFAGVLMLLALSFVSGGTAVAQVPTSATGTGLSAILNIRGVAEELRMTDEQQNDLQDFNFEIRQQVAAKSRDFRRLLRRDLTDQQRSALTGEWLMAIQAVRKSEEESIAKVLDKDQLKRLKQIRFQFLARRPNGMDIIAESLELNDKQLKAFKKLKQEYQKKLHEVTSQKGVDSIVQLEKEIKKLKRTLDARISRKS